MGQTNAYFTSRLSLLLTILVHLSTALAYKWPNSQISEVDHQLYDQFGYHGNVIFTTGVRTCSRFPSPILGRQNAAEVRLYHS
jgi:hypothetical protein